MIEVLTIKFEIQTMWLIKKNSSWQLEWTLSENMLKSSEATPYRAYPSSQFPVTYLSIENPVS